MIDEEYDFAVTEQTQTWAGMREDVLLREEPSFNRISLHNISVGSPRHSTRPAVSTA